MKKIQKLAFYFLLLFTAIVISCGNKTKSTTSSGEESTSVQGQKGSNEKKIPFERGSYVEENTTLGMDLKKTVYFDKWGEWTASEDKNEMTIMGHTIKTHKLAIVKGKTHWDIDLIEKTGTSFEFDIPVGLTAALGLAMGAQMMDGTEIKDLGEEVYLGYKCKKTQVIYSQMEMDVITLAYGNLTMKTEGKMGQMTISSRITSIDLSAPPASIFEVPAGVEITKN